MSQAAVSAEDEETAVAPEAPPAPPAPPDDELADAMRRQDRDAVRRILAERSGDGTRPPSAGAAASVGFEKHDFSCSICSDLLWKPCVNECGHAFCFWCLHRAMSPLQPR